MQRGTSNTYDFYETPHHKPNTEKNDTSDGYDFAANVQETPQDVYNNVGEDIEININNKNSINNCGVEKQVSPTPTEEKEKFNF